MKLKEQKQQQNDILYVYSKEQLFDEWEEI